MEKKLKSRYVIVGNSVAGINCIEGIREFDREGTIIVFSDEEILNYSRPLISYYLAGRLNEDALSFRDKRFYERNNINLFTGTSVRKIDIRTKIVYTDKGKYEFDYLFIGTGGKPIMPTISGIDKIKEGIFTFTKLSDAKKIKSFIEKEKIQEAVILGGGLIGLKCAEALLERKISIKIIELADRILPNTFDHLASEIIENKLKEKGCEVIKKNTIEKVHARNSKLKEVILSDGRKIKTQILIVGIGVLPELKIVENTEILRNRGIIVNEHMQTNIPFIYAGGDVAEADEFISEKKVVIPIWPVAARMGKIAGANMAGENKKYDGMFAMNSVEFLGIPTISFGMTNPPDSENYQIIKKVDVEKSIYKKIVIRDNTIIGAIYLGNIERAGIITGLIKNRIDISSIKHLLSSDNFGLLVLPEAYRKHMVKGEGIEV